MISRFSPKVSIRLGQEAEGAEEAQKNNGLARCAGPVKMAAIKANWIRSANRCPRQFSHVRNFTALESRLVTLQFLFNNWRKNVETENIG